MGLREILLIKKLGSGIVSVTVGLVLFLGLFLYGSIMSSNPYASMTLVKEETPNAVPAASTSDERAPASVVNLAPAIEKVVVATNEAEVVNLNCFNGTTPVTIKSQAKQLRLRGPVCGNRNTIDHVEVVNRTNGFVGTIFQTDQTKYSSDYIHLASGDNQIFLSFTDASGEQHVAELNVSRHQ
jgi:hypothetical protein